MDTVFFAIFHAFSYLIFICGNVGNVFLCTEINIFFFLWWEISGFPGVSLLLIYTTPEQVEDIFMGRVPVWCLCFCFIAD